MYRFRPVLSIAGIAIDKDLVPCLFELTQVIFRSVAPSVVGTISAGTVFQL